MPFISWTMKFSLVLVHVFAGQGMSAVTTVNYTDPYDGTLLMGYVTNPIPNEVTPAVIILPDWDGVNSYEKTRAEMFASEMGLVSFAADIFGVDNHQPESFEERIALAEKYREDITLYMARIQAAIDYTKSLSSVDPNKVGMVGYCFGGTGALNYALNGKDGVAAVVAMHGSLSRTAGMLNKTIHAKVLIQSGGDDDADSTKSVIDMESALNSGNATWQLDRYARVEHGFTKFGSNSYDPYVDDRSWKRTADFLAEAFAEVELEANIPDSANVQPVEYSGRDETDGVVTLRGYVSYPSTTIDEAQMVEEQRPAVVIIHDADGITEYEHVRAQMIADLGYVAFAADIFGIGIGVDLANGTERKSLLNKYRRENVPLYMSRIQTAIDTAQQLQSVDPNRIALVGYCFGGTGAIMYALSGESDAKAIVSFHGGLNYLEPTGEVIHAKMLIQSGGDDDSASSIEMLEEAMEGGNATWEYARYSDALHAFTEPEKFGGYRYNLRADVGSWDSMKTFLAAVFSGEQSITNIEEDDANSETTETMMTDKTVPEEQVKAFGQSSGENRRRGLHGKIATFTLSVLLMTSIW